MIALQCSVWAPRVGFFALGRGQMWLGGTPTCTRMYTSLLPPLPALACGDNTSRPHMHTHAPPPSAPTDAAHCSPRRAEAGVPHSCHCRCPCARRCPHLRPYPPGPTLSLSLPLPLLAAQFRRRCGSSSERIGGKVRRSDRRTRLRGAAPFGRRKCFVDRPASPARLRGMRL